MKKIWGEQKCKIVPNLGALFVGHFYYKIGLKIRYLAKMLAPDQSNAKFPHERGLMAQGCFCGI